MHSLSFEIKAFQIQSATSWVKIGILLKREKSRDLAPVSLRMSEILVWITHLTEQWVIYLSPSCCFIRTTDTVPLLGPRQWFFTQKCQFTRISSSYGNGMDWVTFSFSPKKKKEKKKTTKVKPRSLVCFEKSIQQRALDTKHVP